MLLRLSLISLLLLHLITSLLAVPLPPPRSAIEDGSESADASSGLPFSGRGSKLLRSIRFPLSASKIKSFFTTKKSIPSFFRSAPQKFYKNPAGNTALYKNPAGNTALDLSQKPPPSPNPLSPPRTLNLPPRRKKVSKAPTLPTVTEESKAPTLPKVTEKSKDPSQIYVVPKRTPSLVHANFDPRFEGVQGVVGQDWEKGDQSIPSHGRPSFFRSAPQKFYKNPAGNIALDLSQNPPNPLSPPRTLNLPPRTKVSKTTTLPSVPEESETPTPPSVPEKSEYQISMARAEPRTPTLVNAKFDPGFEGVVGEHWKEEDQL